ncbi:MAG: ABC transporter ATP-binding protein [Brevinemataceae bacterium]
MFLDVKNISFKYPNVASDTIDKLSFSLEKNKIAAIMGTSGSGKSTLLKILAGFEDPYEGSIILDKRELIGKNYVITEKRNIGMVFQNYILFPHLTVSENILFGLDHSSLYQHNKKERLEEILTLIEMTNFRDALPHTLSGGQQQRTALGRALAPSPQLLLLDEPLSNLDVGLKNKIRLEMKNILKKSGSTVLMVTHNAGDLDIADYIFLIDKGTFTKQGTLEELRNDKNCPYIDYFTHR